MIQKPPSKLRINIYISHTSHELFGVHEPSQASCGHQRLQHPSPPQTPLAHANPALELQTNWPRQKVDSFQIRTGALCVLLKFVPIKQLQRQLIYACDSAQSFRSASTRERSPASLPSGVSSKAEPHDRRHSTPPFHPGQMVWGSHIHQQAPSVLDHSHLSIYSISFHETQKTDDLTTQSKFMLKRSIWSFAKTSFTEITTVLGPHLQISPERAQPLSNTWFHNFHDLPLRCDWGTNCSAWFFSGLNLTWSQKIHCDSETRTLRTGCKLQILGNRSHTHMLFPSMSRIFWEPDCASESTSLPGTSWCTPTSKQNTRTRMLNYTSVVPKQFACRSIWFHGIWGLSQQRLKVVVSGGWWRWYRRKCKTTHCIVTPRLSSYMSLNNWFRAKLLFQNQKLNSLKSEIPAAGQTPNQRLASDNVTKKWEIQSKRWQVGDKCKIMRAKKKTHVWGHPEDKCKIMRAKNPVCSGRQLGDKSRQVGEKCEVMRTKALEHPERTGRQVENTRRQVGAKCEIVRAENPECLWQENKPGDKRKIMRPEHAPLPRSKNPQVNLFGEKYSKAHGMKTKPHGVLRCPFQG